MKTKLLVLIAGLLPLFASAASQPLTIDKNLSRVDIAVKVTIDSFVGRLADYDAAITVDADTGKVTGATFTFLFTAVKTGKDERDKKMLAWEENAKFPEGVFTLTTIEPAPPGGRALARGTLTLHGVTHDLAFPVSVTTDKKLYAIDGEAVIDTRDYGLPIIRMMALLKVDPAVTVRFHVQGALKP